MADKRPIGKLDHIGIAVRSIAEARKFFEEVLGASFDFEVENPEAGWRLVVLDLKGLSLELLEPLGEGSFLHKFLGKRGEGLHHLTFEVSDIRERLPELKERGVRLVDPLLAQLRAGGVRVVDEFDLGAGWKTAFISPRSAHGVLIQLGSGFPTLNRAPEWETRRRKS
jgi:methylmalonyl-CoA epimerase